MRISFRRQQTKPAPKRAHPSEPKPPCERCRKLREAAKRLIGLR